jgi:hypothetical protein
MVYEGRLAESLGIAAAGTVRRITSVLERLHLPTERPDGSQVDDLVTAMRTDKKVRAGEIRLALPSAIGTAHGSDGEGWTVADVVLQLAQTNEMAIASVRGDLPGAMTRFMEEVPVATGDVDECGAHGSHATAGRRARS